MGLINALLDEANKRSKENEESKAFIEKERAKLKEKREHAKKSFVRKIKPVDIIASKVEEKQDEKAISKLEADEAERLAEKRRKRRNEIARGIFKRDKAKDATDSKKGEAKTATHSLENAETEIFTHNNRVVKKEPKVVKRIAFADRKQETQLPGNIIADIDIAEENRLIKENLESTKSVGTATNKRVVIIGSIIVALILGGFGISEARERAIAEENYNEAVQFIIDGEYSDARDLLLGLETNDSRELLKYTDIMVNLSSYYDSPEQLLKSLNAIGQVENDIISLQLEDAREQVEKISSIRDQIAALDLLHLSEASVAELDTIGRDINGIDRQWISILNTDNYENIKKLVENIIEQTPLGQLYLGIQGLGEISLESGDLIKSLLDVYNGLSQNDKELVFNANLLSAANTEYETLVKEQERIEQEKREAEEQARLEAEEQARKEAEEKARLEAEEKERAERKEAWLNETVYITRTGKCYHYYGCSTLSRSTNLTPMKRRDAIAAGYKSCSKCGSGIEYY